MKSTRGCIRVGSAEGIAVALRVAHGYGKLDDKAVAIDTPILLLSAMKSLKVFRIQGPEIRNTASQ